MRRRRVIAAIGSSTAITLAGCVGGSGGTNDGTVSGGGTNDNTLKNSKFELSVDETDIVAEFERDKIDYFQILGSDGSGLETFPVTGAETTVTLMVMDPDAVSGISYTEHVDETLEIIAFNEKGEQIGSREFTYSPEVDVVGGSVNSEDKKFEFRINKTNWPVKARIIMNPGDAQPEVEPADVTFVDGADVEDSREQFPNPIQSSYRDTVTMGETDEKVVTLPYVLANKYGDGLGHGESFFDREIEEAEDIEQNISFTANLSIAWPFTFPTDVENVREQEYNVRMSIEGFDTEIRENYDGSPIYLQYIPKNISIESVNKK